MKRVGSPHLGSTGRFGNALWIVASTLGLARARGLDPVFPEWDYSPYLSCPPHWFDPDALRRSYDARRLTGLPHAQRPYMQQHALIADVMDEIREVFQPSTLASEIMADHLAVTDQSYLLDLTDGITLHVRHGDNLNPETHPVGTWPSVTMAYYRKALDHLDPTGMIPLVIFSDDPDWCVENVTDLTGHRPGCIFVVRDGYVRPPDYFPSEYAAGPAMDWVDLQLMAMFTGGHIIANSTYSLWGALLGPAPTTYPDNWVGFRCRDAVPDESTICPPDWTMIHNPVPENELVPPC